MKLEQWNRKACLDRYRSNEYRIFNNSKVRKFFTSNYTNCFCISKITFRTNVKERFYPRVPFYSLFALALPNASSIRAAFALITRLSVDTLDVDGQGARAVA